MCMEFKDFNGNKVKIWLELGLAFLLVLVIGIAANRGAFDKKDEKAKVEQSPGRSS